MLQLFNNKLETDKRQNDILEISRMGKRYEDFIRPVIVRFKIYQLKNNVL